MINTTVVGELRGVKLESKSLDFVAKYFDEEHENFVTACSIVHRKSVFQVLIRILRLCNVDTGRLRASFTPLMDKWGFQNYQPFMNMPSLAGTERKSKGKGFSDQAVKEGKGLGDFIDQVLDTTITSNVAYASYVNAKSEFLTKALAYGDEIYNRNFEKFFDAAQRQGWIPVQDPNTTEDL